MLALDLPIAEWAAEEGIDESASARADRAGGRRMMAAKAAKFGPELMRYHREVRCCCRCWTQVWKEHLLALDHLRQGIGLRAYGQRDPLNEYKSEAFSLFDAMLDDLKERVTLALAHVTVQDPAEPEPVPMVASHPEPGAMQGGLALAEPVIRNTAAALPVFGDTQVDPGPARDMVRHTPQRPLPLRLGQEV